MGVVVVLVVPRYWVPGNDSHSTAHAGSFEPHVNNTSWFYSQALFLAGSSSIITEKASSLCIFGESGHIYIKGSKF